MGWQSIAFVSLTLSFSCWGAPALMSPLCQVQGEVVEVVEREHVYEPEQWRLSWNLPKSRMYIDVTLKKLVLLQGKDCGFSQKGSHTFQLRDMEDQKKLVKGDCLVAMTQYSGDEFSLGQWLFDLRECDL